MPLIPLFLFILVLLIFFAIWFWKKLTAPSKIPLLQDLSDSIPPHASYEFISNAKLNEFQKSAIAVNSLTYEMNNIYEHHVKAIYLAHGTFVGNDPFQIISLIENIIPESSKNLIETIKNNTKKAGDFFAKDLGNFTDEHVYKLSSACKEKLPIYNFKWSSANNHLARVKGCLDLISKIASDNHHKKDRMLLIGHSHAGQIFSLLTHMLNNPKMRQYIFELLASNNMEVHHHNLLIKKIQNLHYDFVTLGSPARYSWCLSKNMRVLHFINHRSKDVLGGNIKGFLNTKDGDYIQQWGIQGSDIISPIKTEQLINLQLDEVLGVGSNLELFKQNIQLRHRLHNEGHHYLIDYGDNSIAPNFFKSAFGHGIYTKLDLVTFHMHYINTYFYSK